MISWIVIIILIVIGIFAIKLNHIKHRLFIISLVLLALFLYSTMYLVTTQNEADLTSIDGILSTVKVYTGWLANGFNNFKEITGNVIDMDWVNSNSSFFED
jgi:energy-coupling factor transporter transmembrane protein EcfT